MYKLLIMKKEIDMGRQLLRAGTSVGANIEEAIGSSTRKEFLYKMTLAYKECRETHYWLRLMSATNIICRADSEKMMSKAEELLRIIGSIQKSVKASMQ